MLSEDSLQTNPFMLLFLDIGRFFFQVEEICCTSGLQKLY